MNVYSEKKKCSGCTACESVCPKSCIVMMADDEGFEYPVVDEAICIKCGLCKQICPVIGKNDELQNYSYDNNDKLEIVNEVVSKCSNKPRSYVSFIRDDDIRQNSTSGGLFSALANYVISMRGIVIGAELDDDFGVRHSVQEDEEGVARFRGSKYVQSTQSGIYKIVKNILQEGRWVLYTGTPCQVSGLKAYLKKDYENLIAVDVFCHGVGSPLYWKEYLKYIKSVKNNDISKISFREKTYGYNSACLAIYFNDGTSLKKGHDEDYYWHAFSKGMIFRPSCYDCAFKTIKHDYSDFTIGDYWRTDELNDEYKNANGCSLVIVQSQKGSEILKKIDSKINYIEVDLVKALIVNGGWQISKLISSSIKPDERDSIFQDLSAKGFINTANKYTPITLRVKIKARIKPLLYRMGLLDKIKK